MKGKGGSWCKVNEAYQWIVRSEVTVASAADPGGLSAWYIDDDKEFSGEERIFPGGYLKIPTVLASGLDIRLSHAVSAIEYSGSSIAVTTDQGQFAADRVVVTRPPGVLKVGSVAFTPALPDQKSGSISRRNHGDSYFRCLADGMVWRDTLLMSKKLESRLAGAKSVEEFFASAVHELRTPLSAIHGYSELLATSVVTDNEVRSFSGIIHRNSGYVLRLVNSLLDLAKLQSGRFELERKPFDLFSLCREIEEVSTPRAEEKNISFVMKLNFPLPRKVFGDAFRLKQVLLNLTGNAVKFTNEGRVEVAVSFDSSSHTLTFEIIDSGIGLSVEQRENLFLPFVQAEVSIAREFGGTGLGLVISREIVDRMGGTLEVDSTLGEGSVFRVVLPVGRDGAGELLSEPLRMRSRAQSARRIPVLSGNVLVIEDAADTRELVRYLLERTGLQVMTAENGETGLAAALENQFDLILLDRHLSDMDGTAVAYSLHKAGYDRPIIAFSADQLRSRRKWIKDAGLSGAIPKPFSQAELYRGVKKFLKPTSELLEFEVAAQTSEYQQSEEVRAVVEQFVESLPSKLGLIRDAVDGNDFDAAAAGAHKLCSASLFGFPLLEEAARSLEQAAKKGLQTKTVLCLAELKDIIDRIVSRISE